MYGTYQLGRYSDITAIATTIISYRTRIKFYGLIFHVFDWQENSWDNYFYRRGVEGTTVVRFAKYASYCGLTFVDKKAYHEMHKNL